MKKPQKTVLVLIITFLVAAALWTTAQPLGTSVRLFSTSEALALGRSGIVVPDDSVPVTLTPKNNVSAQGSAMFPIGVTMYGNNRVVMVGGTVVSAFNGGKSRVLLMVKIPRDGWYIINCVTTGGPGQQASLMTASPFSFSGSPPAPVTVGAWDYRNRPQGTYLYPALVELKAGTHSFYWILEAGAGAVEFVEANILQPL